MYNKNNVASYVRRSHDAFQMAFGIWHLTAAVVPLHCHFHADTSIPKLIEAVSLRWPATATATATTATTTTTTSTPTACSMDFGTHSFLFLLSAVSNPEDQASTLDNESKPGFESVSGNLFVLPFALQNARRILAGVTPFVLILLVSFIVERPCAWTNPSTLSNLCSKKKLRPSQPTTRVRQRNFCRGRNSRRKRI